MKYCPWCGELLELKVVDAGATLKTLCSKCGYKLKENEKPTEPKVEEQPKVVEIKEEEKPSIKPLPKWPFITTAVAIIALAIILVKVFLV